MFAEMARYSSIKLKNPAKMAYETVKLGDGIALYVFMTIICITT